MKKNLFLSFVSPLALTCALTACGGEPTPGALAEAEQLGSFSAALCTDPGAANYTEFMDLGDVGDEIVSTSPTATYGSALCPGRYVVEATNTEQPNLVLEARWGDSVISQANCTKGRVSASFFGFKNNAWSKLNELTASGTWVTGYFGSYCDVAVRLPLDTSYSKVRVAAKASYDNTPSKVTGSISAHY